MDAKAAELRRVEEEVLRLRKEAERQASKYKLLTTGTSSQKEAELQSEIDKCMVSLDLYFSRRSMITCPFFFAVVECLEMLDVSDANAKYGDHQVHA